MNVCIIPARGGSIGIPKKNLLPMNGLPLLGWSIRQAKATPSIDMIVVSTDDNEIEEYCNSEDVVVIRRPKNISGNTASSEAALIHALEHLASVHYVEPEVVIFLQATSPLRRETDIGDALQKFKATGADSLFSVSIAEDLTLWNLLDGQWTSVNFDYRNRMRRQDAPTQYIENGSIYIVKTALLKKLVNRIGGRIETYIMNSWQVHEIDNMEDAELVEYLMEKHNVTKY